MHNPLSPGAELCHDHLRTLLTEEIDALRDLEVVLENEFQVLSDRNVAAIERTAVIRAQMMSGLARTEEQRRALCRLHGYAPDWHGLEGLMQWCDPQGSLLATLRDCAQRATRCRDLNNKNGTLVGARLKQVEAMLAALRPNQAVTYGPRGVSRQPRSHELGAA